MACSQISIVYGVVLTIEAVRALFPQHDWPPLEDEDEDAAPAYDTVRELERLLPLPFYCYTYATNRIDRFTGVRHPEAVTVNNQWFHIYSCCSELNTTHLMIGRVVGDVEPEQFFDMPDDHILPIWNTAMTLDQCARIPNVVLFPSDYNLTREAREQVDSILATMGITVEPQLYVMADDCYSCT